MNTDPRFSPKLKRWYQKNARDLPWRRTSDPYRIWISEIMLQQTTVAAVVPYYEKWMAVFPAVKDVAAAPPQKILKLWQGLGYYSRARNIHKAARVIGETYGGELPDSYDELLKLPGFGPYTAGAVASIAFDRRVRIIDANVRRVVMRQLALTGHADGRHDKTIGVFLEKVMPRRGNNIFNQAMMELGALICRSRQPSCLLCPVKENCLAYRKGIQETIPEARRKALKELTVVLGLIRRNNRYFIQQRPPRGLFADLWEFPGGKVEAGEGLKTALCREIKEELGVEVTAAENFMTLTHFYTSFKVKLHAFLCETAASPAGNTRRKWVPAADLDRFPMPSGSARIVDKIHSLKEKN